MLVGGVVGHQVDDDLQPAGVGGGDQRVEVRERAEQRIDVAVVADVVAEVRHGRGIERREPDGVDAELGEVVQPRVIPRVADAVAVASWNERG